MKKIIYLSFLILFSCIRNEQTSFEEINITDFDNSQQEKENIILDRFTEENSGNQYFDSDLKDRIMGNWQIYEKNNEKVFQHDIPRSDDVLGFKRDYFWHYDSSGGYELAWKGENKKLSIINIYPDDTDDNYMKSWVDAFEELIGEYDVEFFDEKTMVLKHENGNIYKCYLIEYPEYPEYPDGKLINDIEFLNRYIENESNLDIRYEYDTTLLMYFIKYDEPGLALYLIKKGININEKNMYGQTALHYASSKMFPEVIEGLLKNGAEINIIDDFGQTSLDIIELEYKEGVKNRENVRHLLKSYGAINNKSKNGA